MTCNCGKPSEWDCITQGYCQECWEAHCGKTWFEFGAAFQERFGLENGEAL